jgi:hypothetical protein
MKSRANRPGPTAINVCLDCLDYIPKGRRGVSGVKMKSLPKQHLHG